MFVERSASLKLTVKIFEIWWKMSSGLYKNPSHNSFPLISVCWQFQWNRKLILRTIPNFGIIYKNQIFSGWFLQTDVCNAVYTVNNRVTGVKTMSHNLWSAQKGMRCFGGNIVTFQLFIITCEIPCLRSSHQRCSVRKAVLRNFATFTGKHQCQRLFFRNSLRPSTLLKKSP